MEKELFDWSGWDSLDEGHYMFYNVKLKVHIGELKVGEQFDFAGINFQTGDLSFGNDEEVARFKLRLVVVGEV